MLSVPPFDVVSQLFARKRKQGSAIRPGDIFDVEHYALAIPYADAVVTEKTWAEVIRQQKLGERYGTKVFTMRTLDDFSVWLAES